MLSFFSERQFGCADRLVRILPLAPPAPKLAYDVPVCTLTPKHVLVRDKPLEPDWPARVDPPRADADLGAKAIAEAVSEARTRVHEDARPSRRRARTRCLPQ
jgi:hypothetical protein